MWLMYNWYTCDTISNHLMIDFRLNWIENGMRAYRLIVQIEDWPLHQIVLFVGFEPRAHCGCCVANQVHHYCCCSDHVEPLIGLERYMLIDRDYRNYICIYCTIYNERKNIFNFQLCTYIIYKMLVQY